MRLIRYVFVFCLKHEIRNSNYLYCFLFGSRPAAMDTKVNEWVRLGNSIG